MANRIKIHYGKLKSSTITVVTLQRRWHTCSNSIYPLPEKKFSTLAIYPPQITTIWKNIWTNKNFGICLLVIHFPLHKRWLFLIMKWKRLHVRLKFLKSLIAKALDIKMWLTTISSDITESALIFSSSMLPSSSQINEIKPSSDNSLQRTSTIFYFKYYSLFDGQMRFVALNRSK